MADNPDEKRSGGKTLPPHEAEAQAVRDKMARLRALRLAHEAANPSAAADKAPAARSGPRRTKKESKKTTKSVSLSDWLSTQEDSGRRK
jgi:hypothetical protein